MNTNKHTPGPWRQSERDSDGVQAKDRDGEWTGVAMVSDPNDPMHRTPVSVANAKLIAAAPDMLAALRYVVMVMNAKDGPTFAERREATGRALAVIARAEGSAE